MLTIAHLADSALLVEFTDPDLLAANRRVLALQHALAERQPPGLLDLTPAYQTLLIYLDPLVWPPRRAAADVEGLARQVGERDALTGRVVEVPVRYGGVDGPDLLDVARHTGLSEAEVVRLHAAGEYTVMFVGFLPGFPYLFGLDPRLATPRLPTPRTRTPVGSVGIGGDQTGIYSTPSPGGWRLIGRTPLTLYDPHQDPPTLLRAGDQVRFVAISA